MRPSHPLTSKYPKNFFSVKLRVYALLNGKQPHFRICTFSPETDKYVSGGLRAGHGWEPWISKVLGKMLATYGSDAVLLDVGANIGAHALYAAKLGYRVAGVEPQNINLARVRKNYI